MWPKEQRQLVGSGREAGVQRQAGRTAEGRDAGEPLPMGLQELSVHLSHFLVGVCHQQPKEH